ncbi:MAG: hypothetical protein HQL32_17260, partial [Planctomycetes bacterium]|nr:hypothetical protein [Planctomycetota bacterium]
MTEHLPQSAIPKIFMKSHHNLYLSALALFLLVGVLAAQPQLKSLSRESLKRDPTLKKLKILHVKHKLPASLKNTKSTAKIMKQLGFPSNHESHSSLPNSGYQCEIAVHNLETGKSQTIYKPKGDYYVGHLDLHWSGTKLLFAQSSKTNWRIYEINIDGTGLRQVSQTPEDVDCYEPIYLPDDRIIVASSAPYQCVPCWHGQDDRFVANLYIMNDDGSHMRRLCFDQDHNSNPSLRNNGQVIYSRWDYTGMNRLFNRPLMSMNPDGTLQKAIYGSNSYYPNGLYAPRELPGKNGQFLCILSGYHGSYKSGQLVIVDTNTGFHEEKGIIKRISGQGLNIEVKVKDELTAKEFPQFLTPYPINDNKYLVSVWLNKGATDKGIYLADTNDNVTSLYREKGYFLVEPIPLMSRNRPSMIPNRINTNDKEATLYIQDVY